MTKKHYGLKSEKRVLELLEDKELFADLCLVPGSGCTFYAKEDLSGSDVLIQVKATKSSSYSIPAIELKKLKFNSLKSGKIPIFIVFFTKHNALKILICDTVMSYIEDYIFSDFSDIEWLHKSSKKLQWNDFYCTMEIDSIVYKVLGIEDFV